MLPNGDKITEEEVGPRIDAAGRSNFWTNVALLALPNHIQTKLLFGKGDDIAATRFARLG